MRGRCSVPICANDRWCFEVTEISTPAALIARVLRVALLQSVYKTKNVGVRAVWVGLVKIPKTELGCVSKARS